MRNDTMAPVLTRITTRYVAAEDRVRLSGQLEGAGTVAVWLTLRLLNRLLPKLLSGLEGRPAQMSLGEALRGEVLHGFAQRKAIAAMPATAPVQIADDTVHWVAEAVVISRSATGVALTFRARDGREVLLALMGEALRQWLAIVYRAYGAAGWPGDFWPTWLVESTQPTAPAGLTIH